jgi:hypothetical protein
MCALMEKNQAVISAAIAQSLQPAHCGQNVSPATSVFLRNRQALNSELGTLVPAIAEKLLAVIAFNQVVAQLPLREFDHFAPEGLLVVCPRKVQGLLSLLKIGLGSTNLCAALGPAS